MIISIHSCYLNMAYTLYMRCVLSWLPNVVNAFFLFYDAEPAHVSKIQIVVWMFMVSFNTL